MRHAPRFRAIVKENCGLEMGNLPRWRDFLRGLKIGKPVWITVETEENKRTIQQNRYYWLYLEVIADETGDVADDLHEFFRRKLLPPKWITAQGEETKIPRSTTDLSKAEFTEYLDKICAKTNIPLPDAETAGYISNKGLIR